MPPAGQRLTLVRLRPTNPREARHVGSVELHRPSDAAPNVLQPHPTEALTFMMQGPGALTAGEPLTIELRDGPEIHRAIEIPPPPDPTERHLIFMELPARSEPRINVGGHRVESAALSALNDGDLLDIGRRIGEREPWVDVAGAFPRIDATIERLLVGAIEVCGSGLVRFLLHEAARRGREVLSSMAALVEPPWPAGSYRVVRRGRFLLRYPVKADGTVDDGNVDPTDSDSIITMPGTGAVMSRTEANGIPDCVERAAFWLEHALSRLAGDPFSLHPPRGTIEVRVSGSSGAFSSPGLIWLPGHDLDDRLALRAVHELVHHIQYRYESQGTTDDWFGALEEGGAVFCEDAVIDAYNRYVDWVNPDSFGNDRGPILRPDRPLHELTYDLGVFLKYLGEQRSTRRGALMEPLVGIETYRRLLEQCDRDGCTSFAMRAAIGDLPWYQSFDRYDHLEGTTPTILASNETLLGNFRLALALKDLGDDVPDRRFDFAEKHQPTYSDSPSRAEQVMPASAPEPLGTLTPITTLTASSTVSDYAACYFVAEVAPDVDTIKLDFADDGGGRSPLLDVVLIEDDPVTGAMRVRDIHRAASSTWSRHVANLRDGVPLSLILVVVSGRDEERDFTLQLDAVAPTSDVSITRWNTEAGRHYEIDPAWWTWTWLSPDVWVDNGAPGSTDPRVVLGADNRLFVRVRNQGTADARDITVRLWYQEATGRVQGSQWTPVLDAAAAPQVLTGVVIPAHDEVILESKWAPLAGSEVPHFAIRVEIDAPHDPNADGKSCVSCLGCVDVVGGSAALDMARYDHGAGLRNVIIPRTGGRHITMPGDVAATNLDEPTPTTRVVDTIVVDRLDAGMQDLPQRELEPYEGARREPDQHRHYPTPPSALPPTAAGKALVTVAHAADDRLLGGFTWIILDAATPTPLPTDDRTSGNEGNVPRMGEPFFSPFTAGDPRSSDTELPHTTSEDPPMNEPTRDAMECCCDALSEALRAFCACLQQGAGGGGGRRDDSSQGRTPVWPPNPRQSSGGGCGCGAGGSSRGTNTGTTTNAPRTRSYSSTYSSGTGDGTSDGSCEEWQEAFEALAAEIASQVDSRATFMKNAADALRDGAEPEEVAEDLEGETNNFKGEWICLYNPATGRRQRFYLLTGQFDPHSSCDPGF